MSTNDLTGHRGHAISWLSLASRVTALTALCLAAGSCVPPGGISVDSIDILAFGILEFDRTTASKDPTSSVGARLVRGQKLRISQQTDRIPLRQGLSYGVAFIVNGIPSGAIAEVKVILRSSSPCVLKETGQVVHHNDSVLQVRIGELRHIGGMIASGDDNHCVDTPGPGTETFELHYGGRKLAEKSFHLFIE